MIQYQNRVITFDVRADDVHGQEVLKTLNELGTAGWEPWHMFTSAASGAFRFPGPDQGRIWVSIWIKRVVQP